jgi:formylglycine-generating enzyme required for sulfatase activity
MKEHPFVNSLGMRFAPVPGTKVLFSVWETRVKDYQAFCDATGRSWEPIFRQAAPEHLAANVSWEDAKAFCEWLSEKEGKTSRI